MIGWRLQVDKPLTLNMTGKFVSPSPDWMHMSRELADYELIVQTWGTLYLADEAGRHALQEGDFLLMPPGTGHYGYRGSDCSFYWLHFAAPEQTPCRAESGKADPGCIVIPSAGTLGNADKIVVMMKQLQDSVRNYQDQTLNNYLATGILCELYHQTCRSGSKPKLKQLQLYNDIVDYIRWHRFEPLKVTQIAARFGYNAKYLSHLFAEIAGVTLKQFMMQQKMEAASYLLTDTNQTVKQIAMQLGYSDSQHFMKAFKQATNLTPTHFRNAAASRLLYYV